MIFYNITFLIDKEIGSEGLAYIKGTFIPEATAGGVLFQPCMRKLLAIQDNDGESYAVQFRAGSLEGLRLWNDEHGRQIRINMHERFGERILCIETIMEKINHEQ
ncbi:MAG: DUF4286 family protein [Tannerellaceae bacterium]|jgi:hypothetical protein|nr:DUF4286 family protein [Tannerellaceae bacterium]